MIINHTPPFLNYPAGRHPGSFSWASTPPPDSRQHDANLDKDDEFI